MMRTKGWEVVSKFIDENIADFNNRSINKGFSSFDTYNFYRGRANGMKSIKDFIQQSIDVLNEERYGSKN